MKILLVLGLIVVTAQARIITGTAGYTSTAEGLWLDGSTDITYDINGPNAVAESYYESDNYEILDYRDAHFTPFFSGASCAYVNFQSNYSTVTAFLVNKENFQKMYKKGTFTFSNYQNQSFFWWNNKINGSYLFNLNTTTKYAIVAINTGGQSRTGVLTGSSTNFRISLAIYGASSSVCDEAKQPGGYSTSNKAAQNDANILPYYELSDTITRTQNSSFFTTLTGLSCLSVQLPAQPLGSQDLDLTATVMSMSKYLEWFRSGRANLTWTGAAVTQSGSANFNRPSFLSLSSTPAAPAGSALQISKLQGGQMNIDGLNPKSTYVVVVWNGLNGGGRALPSTDVLLRYGGKSTGTCNSTRFVDVDNDYITWTSTASAPGPSSQALLAPSPLLAPRVAPSQDVTASSLDLTSSPLAPISTIARAPPVQGSADGS